MNFAALIPFLVLVISFAGLRLPLTHSSWIALLTGSLITQTLFQATSAIWHPALIRTLELCVEIGLILMGAFFFIETAKKTGIIDSLARLIESMSPNRAVQAVLVSFPFLLLVEGSSGFGTPLLVITPILYALNFELELCVILPFITMVIGIPFGALGTPTRLGFPGSDPAHGIFIALAPFTFLAPPLVIASVFRKLPRRELMWAFSISGVYFLSGLWFSRFGPELAALGPAFFSLVWGLWSAGIWFPHFERPNRDFKGILVYGLLLIVMGIGKQIFMDQLIEGTHIRIFNPGFVFILFSFLILGRHPDGALREVLTSTLARSRRTLTVFFCITFLVQQTRTNGSLDLLSRTLPPFFLGSGTPILGWIGSMLAGTSTLSNLLLSKLVDPAHQVPLAVGSAIGVQLAFQSTVAMKSILHDRLSEKKIFSLLAPLSLLYLVLAIATLK